MLYLLGLGFLAGQDVKPERFRGSTFRLAGSAFGVSAVLAVPVASGLRAVSCGADVRLVVLSASVGEFSFVTLLIFTALAHRFGLDALLGAFTGGVAVGIPDGDERPSQERYQAKIRAIGYGVPGPGVLRDDRGAVQRAGAAAVDPGRPAGP